MRRKDVVLMATVTSFEDLEHPTKSELRQFAELFTPLFQASSEEARRQAVAALSRSPTVPQAVAFFIASQPISISAPFLSASQCLDDDALVTIARSQGSDHARAIARRDNLSVAVVDALVSLRQSRQPLPPAVSRVTASQQATPAPTVSTSEASTNHAPSGAPSPEVDREEALRRQLKQMAAMQARLSSDRLGLRTVTAVQEALLVRFARAREADAFATTLADTLSASRWLAERIMLDISGHQLGTTLKGIGMPRDEAMFILERFYGHLREVIVDTTRSEILWQSLDEDDCSQRVEAWRRADRYTYADPQVERRPEAPRHSLLRAGNRGR
ncbi:DUF2336 domain-containing protein [Rhizobium sp. FY34]|uniref:DUF2336 domain-containing protein n=1 Tax=Rhizobium sp. FY34 TaxID=2562309 RepID=UPI001FF0612C|nr:DUF2336 domain-containing protein [Rhizobium sp. FY34]